MMHRLRLDAALAALARQQAAAVAQLRAMPAQPELLATRRELDDAVQCLRFCERHQLHPDAAVLALPWPRESFGSFGLVELEEAGEPLGLPAFGHPRERVALSAGGLIVTPDHHFNLPPKDEGHTA